MKKTITFLFSFFLLINTQAQTAVFDALLKKHVTVDGIVDYAELKKEEKQLDVFLNYLAATSPVKNWSANKTKAFWVNAYNAYTIKVILENYPVKSIMKIKEAGKDAWNIPFAKVGQKTYTLNFIEHEVLRKDFADPRIHVGVNCASGSCPKLGNFAFTEKNIDAKLEGLMVDFINDSNRNKITKKKVQLSKIFEWFQGDFTKNGSLIAYLNTYTTIKIDKKAKIRFLEYDWNLNGK